MSETGAGWILLSLAVWGAIHSLLASLWFKDLVRRWSAMLYERGYRLFFNIFAIASFLPVLVLVALLPDRLIYTIPLPWSLLTMGVQGLALVGLAYGVSQTGMMNFLGLEQLLDPQSAVRQRPLVTDGLYRYVRHPLYFFGLLLIWLVPRMSWNWLAFSIGATLYLTIGTLFEERKLRQEFGEAYEEYRRRTPMLIPRLKPPKGID
ncbi:MAG: isoprenylcysteine carboxylmethyltransferase family protein [Anaerolineales bacterium]|jgi:protein-S-isoprenylcysteine O-methyltransferase Ste14